MIDGNDNANLELPDCPNPADLALAARYGEWCRRKATREQDTDMAWFYRREAAKYCGLTVKKGDT